MLWITIQGSLIVTKYATQLLMLTGVRTKIELRAAEWAEFDLDNALWEIPKERMKKRRPHLVPLSTQAINILKKLQEITGDYSLVSTAGMTSVNQWAKPASTKW